MPKNTVDHELVSLLPLAELIAWDPDAVDVLVSKNATDFQTGGKYWIAQKFEELSGARRTIRMAIDDVLMDGQSASDLIETYKRLTLENTAFRVFCLQGYQLGDIDLADMCRWDERALVYSEILTGMLTFHMSAESWQVRLDSDGLPYLKYPEGSENGPWGR